MCRYFENTILANNKEYYPEAFVGAECLVFLMSEDTDLCELISFKRFLMLLRICT